MKKSFLLLLSCLISITLYAQQKPTLQRTTGAQVVSDRALKANTYFAVPVVTTLAFPSFVADSNKIGSLQYKSTSGDTSLYIYNGLSGKWDQIITKNYLIAHGSSSVTWGGITGTLSSQSDLQAALDLKANLAGTPLFSNGLSSDNTIQITTTTGTGAGFNITDGTSSSFIRPAYITVGEIGFNYLQLTPGYLNFQQTSAFYSQLSQATLTAVRSIILPDANGTVALTNQLTGLLSTTNFITREIPSGTINGINVTFTLANTPVIGTEQVFKNGQLLTYTTDYTISGGVITTVLAPLTGSVIIVNYQK